MITRAGAKEPVAYCAPRLLHHPGTPTVPPDATPRRQMTTDPSPCSILLAPLQPSLSSTALAPPAPLDAPPATYQCAHKDCIDDSKPISVGIVPDRELSLRLLMTT